jgi:putative PIN family toxin of toxin-antitoxin system
MGKKKIVLDTNILISAFGWKGKSQEIFNRVLNGELELFSSQKQMEEIVRVLAYPKFGFQEEQKSRFISILYSIAKIVDIPGKLKVIADDPDDDVILETAVVSNSKFLVTGDEHLLSIKEYKGVMILTASELLDVIKKKS